MAQTTPGGIPVAFDMNTWNDTEADGPSMTMYDSGGVQPTYDYSGEVGPVAGTSGEGGSTPILDVPTPGSQSPSFNTGDSNSWQPGSVSNWFNSDNFNPDLWSDPEYAQQMTSFTSNMLPIYQANQNAYQYQNDFLEAQSRWDEQFSWQQQNDTFSQSLATQQQALAQQQADRAYEQWQQQFGYQQGLDAFDQGMAQQQFDLQNQQAQWQQGNWQQQFDQEASQWAQQFGLENQQAAWQQGNWEQQFGHQQDLDRIAQENWTQQFGLQQTQQQLDQFNAEAAQQFDYDELASLDQWRAMQDAQATAQLGLQAELGRGDLTLRGEIARNQNALQQAELALQDRIQTGQLDLGRQELAGLNNWRNTQATLQREGNQLQRDMQRNQIQFQREEMAQNARLASERNRIEEQYKSGLISNEQARIEIARAESERQYALGQAQVGIQKSAQQMERWWRGRGMDLQAQAQQHEKEWRSRGLGIQERQLTQTGDIARERLAAEERMHAERLRSEELRARWSQFGRNQAPTARFIRTF